MEKASNLLLKFSRQLFTDTAQQEQFVRSLTHPQPFAPCILWCRPKPTEPIFQTEPPSIWQPDFVDRLTPAQKPGQHPRHASGEYYCLDFSSVFAASVLLTLPQNWGEPLPEQTSKNSDEQSPQASSTQVPPKRVVFDVCASPGGKSIFVWRALQPDLLLCNEVIGKRIGALVSNLKRCQIKGSKVVSLDSEVLAASLPSAANVVLVDAPCTGQSLLAKGDKAPGCFHPVTINRNANRQKRILANSASMVAPQGYLVYTTCAFSPAENEEVLGWLLDRFAQFEPVVVPHLAAYQSHLTSLPCYRMFPQDGWGAGAFTVLLKNQTTGEQLGIPDAFWQRPGIVSI